MKHIETMQFSLDYAKANEINNAQFRAGKKSAVAWANEQVDILKTYQAQRREYVKTALDYMKAKRNLCHIGLTV